LLPTALPICSLVLALHAQPLVAQAAAAGVESPTAAVAALGAVMYNDQANTREASDSAMAGLATQVLRARLAELLGPQLVDATATDSLALSPEALAVAAGVPCPTRLACARFVGRSQAAPWVVMTKVSKTSNLIWLLSAQLVHVSTGEIVLDDTTELKGDPGTMIRVGTRIFAERVARTIKHGGQTTNFPQAS
jgi:hypothetical protein